MWTSKLARFFGNSYLHIKRFLATLIGFLLIAFATTLAIYPEILFQDEQDKRQAINDAKEYYAEMAGVTFEKAILKILENKNSFSKQEFISTLNKAIEQALLKEAIEGVRYLAIPLLFIAFFLFYVSRLTRKMHERNKKISNAESITQEIIDDYIKSIDIEEEELVEIQKLIQNMNNVKSH